MLDDRPGSVQVGDERPPFAALADGHRGPEFPHVRYRPAVVHLTVSGAPILFDDEGRADHVQREVCGRVLLLQNGWLHIYTDDWAPGGTGELLLPPGSISRVELMR